MDLPPGLVRGEPIRISCDNIDKKVDTPDGKNSFHAMTVTVYQCAKDGEVSESPVKDLWPLPPGGLVTPKTVVKLSDSTITGYPKPTESPKYRNYQTGNHRDVYENAIRSYEVWLIARCILRSDSLAQYHTEDAIVEEDNEDPDTQNDILQDDDEEEEDATHSEQPSQIPVWSVYHSLMNSRISSYVTDRAVALLIINAPPQEWKTLITSLETLSKVNIVVHANDSKLITTFDMDLYKTEDPILTARQQRLLGSLSS